MEGDRQPGIDRAESVEVVRWGTVQPKIICSIYISESKSAHKYISDITLDFHLHNLFYNDVTNVELIQLNTL
jgi:hypothetical protein